MTDKEIVIAAAEAMGWEPEPFPCAAFANARTYGGKLTVWNDTFHIEQFEGWNPLTSISDAWMLVEALVSRGVLVIVKGDGLRRGDFNPKWTVLIDSQPRVDADSAPRAITLAALKAVEGGKA